MAYQVSSVRYEVDDAASAAADKIAASVTGAADAMDNLSVQTATTEQTVTRSTRSWQTWTNQNDDVTRAANQLAKAQRDLAAATTAGSDALAKGTTDQATFAAVLTSLQDKVDNASAKLRAAKTAAAELASAMGDQSATFDATSAATDKFSQAAALAEQRMKAQQDAIAGATAAQRAFNQALGVNTAGDGFRSAADSAQFLGAELDRLRAKYDPLFVASKRYESTLEDIAQAEKLGALSAATATAARDRATASFASANETMQQYGRAQRDAVAAAEAYQQSFNQALGVDGSFKDAADSAQFLGAELDRLRAKYDPLFAASKQYEAVLDDIGQAEKVGALSAVAAADARERATAAFAASNDVMARHNEAQQAANATAAQAQATFNQVLGVNTTGSGYKDAAESAQVLGSELDQLRAKYDPLFATSKQYEAELENIAKAQRLGAINATTATDATEKLNAAFAAGKPIENFRVNVNAAGKSSELAGQQMRLLGVQAIQAASGLATGQGAMMVFVQQGHQVLDTALASGAGLSVFGTIASKVGSFLSGPGGLVLAGVAVAGSLVAMGVAAESQQRVMLGLSTQLRTTRTDATAMAQEIDAAARLAAAHGTISLADARAAGSKIGAVPTVTPDRSGLADAIELADRIGAAYGSAADGPAKLAQALAEPGKVAQDLADHAFPGMTQALARNIELMARSGDVTGAAREVLQVYSAQLATTAEAHTPLQNAMLRLHSGMSDTESGMKGLASSVGQAVDSLATGAVNAIARIVETMRSAREAIGHVVPWSSTYGDYTPNDQQKQLVPFIAKAAEATGVDPLLLGRLQNAEGQVDPKTGTWKNSATGPVGAFQVAPSTFQGMLRDQGSYPGLSALGIPAGISRDDAAARLSNPATNVAAGAAYFAYLLKKYDNKMNLAVEAYHDGETVIDKVLASGGITNANQYSGLPGVDDDKPTASRAALDEADKVLGGYTGPGLIARAAKAPELPPGVGYSFPPASAAVPLADADALRRGDALTASINRNGVPQQRENNAADLTQLQHQIELQEKYGISTKATAEALATLTGKQNDTRTSGELYVRTLTDQNRTNGEVYQGDRQLADAREHLNELARSNPNGVSDADRQAAIVAVTQAQSHAYQVLAGTMGDQVSAQNDLAHAYTQGYGAVEQATARTQAFQALTRVMGPSNRDFGATLDALTIRYEQLAEATAKAQVAQQTRQNRDQLDYLAAETQTLGQNDDVRTAALNHLRAEQELRAKNVSAVSDEGRAYLDSVDAISAATAAYQHQSDALQEIGNFGEQAFSRIGESITQAATVGGSSAVTLGSIWKGVVSEIEQEAFKLILLNPLQSAITGKSLPTLAGVLSAATGNGGGAVSVIQSAAGITSAATPALTVDSASSGSSPFATAAAGTGAVLSAGANVSAVASALGVDRSGSGSSFLSLGNLSNILSVGKSLIGTGASNTGFTLLDNVLNTPLLGSQAAIQASTPLASNVAGPVLSPSSAGVTTVGQVVGGIGAGYSAGSLIGGLLAGKSEGRQMNAQIGSAGGAVLGAAIGSVVPVVGTFLGGLLGGALGGAGGGLIGPGPMNQYGNIAVNAVGGKLQLGGSYSQLEDNSAQLGQVAAQVGQLNAYLAAGGLTAAARNPNASKDNGNGDVNIGSGVSGIDQVQGLESDGLGFLKFSSASDPRLSEALAKSAPSDVSSLQSLVSFFRQTVPALIDSASGKSSQYDAKLKSFTDSVSDAIRQEAGYGVTDTSNLTDALASGTAKMLADANHAFDQHYGQLMAGALSNSTDPGQQAAGKIAAFDVSAQTQMDQEKQNLIDMLGASVEGTARFNDAMSALAGSLGEQRAALVQQIAQQRQAAADAIGQQDQTLWATHATLTGDPVGAAGLTADVQAAQQRAAWSQQLTAAFGDAFTATDAYTAQMGLLDMVLAEQRQAAVDAAKLQVAANVQAVADTDTSLWARINANNHDPVGAATLNFDVQANQQRAQLTQQLVTAYGAAFVSTGAYVDQMDLLNTALSGERQAAIDAAQQQRDQALRAVNDNDASVAGRLLAAHGDQQGAALANQAIQAADERANLTNTLISTFGNAYTQTAEYARRMTALETTQQAERAAIVQQYTNQAAQAANGVVSGLNSYVSGLLTGSGSPLSARDQLDAARSQFTDLAAKAQGGDYTALTSLQAAAETYRTDSQAVNGSGVGYADSVAEIANVIGSVADMGTDRLTASYTASLFTNLEAVFEASVADLKAEVIKLRQQVAQQTRVTSLS